MSPDEMFARVEARQQRREPRQRAGSPTPYPTRMLAVLECVRCRRQGCATQVKVDDDLYRPLCRECGALLRREILGHLRDPEAEQKARAYRVRLLLAERTISAG